jgi:hypothetical protein
VGVSPVKYCNLLATDEGMFIFWLKYLEGSHFVLYHMSQVNSHGSKGHMSKVMDPMLYNYNILIIKKLLS